MEGKGLEKKNLQNKNSSKISEEKPQIINEVCY